MSYLGIMSRGYLCPVVPQQINLLPGPPGISGSAELFPSLTGSSQPIDQAPAIVDAVAEAPTLRGAVSDEAPTLVDSPSVSGGSLLVPIIRKAEED